MGAGGFDAGRSADTGALTPPPPRAPWRGGVACRRRQQPLSAQGRAADACHCGVSTATWSRHPRAIARCRLTLYCAPHGRRSAELTRDGGDGGESAASRRWASDAMRRPLAFAQCAQLLAGRSAAPRARFAACARVSAERPAAPPNVIDVLQKRGLLDACTAEPNVVRELCQKPITVYTGFDPTADSLHLGNLLAILALAWFQRCGHRVVALLGGATARVGDPSGKSVERPVLGDDAIQRNLNGIEANLRQVLERSERQLQQAGMPNQPFVIANNYDWLGQISFLHFLRDVGKHARVNTMIAKDSVKTRLASDDGISFTEFTYQLLQAFDFVHLSDTLECVMQLGGSDQWGNITAGTELARKIRSRTVHGITFPLLTTADGKKFGKSENGAVWLSSDKLSPYQFYQFLIRTTDEDVITLLKRLTFLPLAEIETIEQQMNSSQYVPNTAQKRLAEEVTRIVHGDEGVQSALAATAAAAPGSRAVLSVEALEAIASDMPSASFEAEEIFGIGVVDLMVKGGLQKSKGEARRLIRNGGGYLNNEKITDERAVLKSDDLVGGKLALLAAGKKNKLLVRIK